MLKKTLIIAAAVAATLAAPMAASAQSRNHDRDRDGRYENWERRADHNRRDGGVYTRNERYNDYRRGVRDQYHDGRYSGPRYSYGNAPRYNYAAPRRWYRGATIPYGYRSNWYVRDYGRYGYRAPPRGYGYYRTDTGDIVLAAIATGVIASLLTNNY